MRDMLVPFEAKGQKVSEIEDMQVCKMSE